MGGRGAYYKAKYGGGRGRGGGRKGGRGSQLPPPPPGQARGGTGEDLRAFLRSLERQSYGAYQELRGTAWTLQRGVQLKIDQCQKDAFAPPSRCRVVFEGAAAQLPNEAYATKVSRIATGDQHSAALSRDGKLYTWGHGGWGELGHGEPPLRGPELLEELRPTGGEIRQHRLGSGPWVHVRFTDHWQQQQALAKNGKVVHGMMIGVLAGIHPTSDSLDASGSNLSSVAAGGGGLAVSSIPLRLQQHRHLGPSLKAPPVSAFELGKAGWWTRLCEHVFGW